MWKFFDDLTLQGKTLTFIKNVFAIAEDVTIQKYSDIFLLKRMIRTLRAESRG